MLSELIFSVLGRLQISHRQMGAITLANRKAIGLLSYLLIESDHAHTREFLLGLLWPDLPTASAQNNLSVTWAQLQKTLGIKNSNSQPCLIGDRLIPSLPVFSSPVTNTPFLSWTTLSNPSSSAQLRLPSLNAKQVP